MLTQLHIQNFTLVDHLALDLRQGMTVITGETGAGKSILLGALSLAVGDRTDASKVRAGASKADITATFDVSRLTAVQAWLMQHDLTQSDSPHECLLRRVITHDGKSKAFINGHPVTLAQLRALGDQLVDIHSQHEHQSLLIKDTHRRLLDEYAAHAPLLDEVRLAYREWQTRRAQFIARRDNQEEISARFQLLHYQVSELEQLNLGNTELAELEAEQRQLTHIDDILRSTHQVQTLCSDDEQGLRAQLHRALQLMRHLPEKNATLKNAEELLDSAVISIEEAARELDYFIDGSAPNPGRLQEVEDRLTAIYDIARKHRTQPEALPELFEGLSLELESLRGSDASLDQLESLMQSAQAHYQKLALTLSKGRQKAATQLAKAVNQQLKLLAMENANLSISLTPLEDKCNSHGLEDIEFLVSTNPGQAPRALAKVASGGELSRISLAIQVVTAQTSATPSLVFDEVDVGIGGATGEVVGQLLRELGESGQVMCVTHLAQVASKGHHHLRVAKSSQKDSTASHLEVLNAEERVEEIARMMGGIKMTEQTRAHAREMLAVAV